MKPLAREWVDKAEGDYFTAQRELRARKHPNFDAVCFHAQQCAEKYLKAILQEAGIQFGKTHNLPVLLNLAITADPMIEALRIHLVMLNEYAIEIRYPGDSADKELAKEALAACRVARKHLRASLKLKT